MLYDFILKGGKVVDGTGAPGVSTDLAIVGERIAAIGDLSSASAKKLVDVTGQVVAPGFIDAHTHSDTYLLLEPDAPSKLTQGITTEVNGQCGGSSAPRLGRARLPSDWASHFYPPATGETSATPGPTWSTVAEYRDLLNNHPPAINTIQFIGHNTLRAGVTGYDPRTATAEEVKLKRA